MKIGKPPEEAILVDSERGKEFGFTGDKYSEESYLWQFSGSNEIYISFIRVTKKRMGHFKQLVYNIINKGYTVKVPVPLGSMEIAVKKMSFKKTYEQNEQFGEEVEVWVRKPKKYDKLPIYQRGD